eukprot:492248-Pyramimonas_sp.AAC.1
MPKSSTRYYSKTSNNNLRTEALRVTAARSLERQRWAAGGHHHCPASSLKPSSSQRALREHSLFLAGRPTSSTLRPNFLSAQNPESKETVRER